MGWFSASVMGGDTPMDYEGDFIIDICEIDYDTYLDSPRSKFRKEIESNIDKLVAHANEQDDPIAFQVLGVLLVESGSAFSEEVRNMIIRGIDLDDWAAEGDKERLIYMWNFKELIKKYDLNGGTISEVQYEGLFDKIAEGMAKAAFKPADDAE